MHRIRRLSFFALFGLAIAGTMVSAGHGAEPRLASSQAAAFLRFFDALALTPDYGPFNRRPAWVRKWNGPVSVILVGQAESLRDEVNRLFARVSRWTGISFSIAPAGSKPRPTRQNVITLRLISQDELTAHFSENDIVCQTETHGVGGELHTGFIVLSDRYTDCLKHEIMHVLGFDAHWRPQQGTEIRSVLSYRNSPKRAEDFSKWDIMAIRMLYDWRIQAGMPRQTSLLIARQLITERPQRAALTPRRIRHSEPW